MRIKKMGLILRIMTFGWARGISLAPIGIFIREEHFTDPVLINKEKIHWAQQMELLILPFYVWYLAEWIIRLPINGKSAYRKIWFEQEVAKYGHDLNYPNIRKRFNWLTKT